LGEESGGGKPNRPRHKIINAFENDADEVEDDMMQEVRSEAKHVQFSRDHFAELERKQLLSSSLASVPKIANSNKSGRNTVPAVDDEDEEFAKFMASFDGNVDKLLEQLQLTGDTNESDDESVENNEEELMSNRRDDEEDSLSMDDFSMEELDKLLGDDNDVNDEEAVHVDDQQEDVLAPPAWCIPNATVSSTSKHNVTDELLQLIDGSSEADKAVTPSEALMSQYSDERIDELWDMVEFGKTFSY
jgi:hypothetical protein